MAKGPKPVFDYLGNGWFKAEARFVWTCDQDYVVHEKYKMDITEARSAASHSHYFAAVTEAWSNLPENQAHRWPTPEHLRKWALVQCGYAHADHRIFSTKQDALTAAAMARSRDKYAVISVNDNIVTIYTAESQSLKNMDKKKFGESKQKVLDLLSDMLHITPKQLERHAKGALHEG